MSSYIHRAPSQKTGRLVVPVLIARAVPADAKFEAELTDEGILYRFVGIVPRGERPHGLRTLDHVPAWAQNGAAHSEETSA